MTLTYEQWLADPTTAPHIGAVDAYKIKPGDLIAHNGYVICVEAIRPVDPRSPSCRVAAMSAESRHALQAG